MFDDHHGLVSWHVLQPPIEPTQYVSIHYTKHLSNAGLAVSVGSAGDAYACQAINTKFRKNRVGLTRAVCPLVATNPDGAFALYWSI